MFKSIRSHTILAAIVSLAATIAPVNAINDTAFLQDPEHIFWHDVNDLPTLRLSFSQQNWDLLLTSTSDDREEVSADMTYIKGGQEYILTNIGAKLSGNTSFTLPQRQNGSFIQASFTLDFDEFVDDQVLSGVSALKLKRFNSDSTFVHEPLSNQIMHNFDVWTVHSSTHVRLEIQIADSDIHYFGMYRANESVNRHEYLDKRFGTDNDGGALWQGNYKDFGPALFSRITADWAGIGDFDQASFEYKGKGSKYDEARAQLVEMAQNFTHLEGADFKDYVDQHINMPLFLKSMASEAVLGHWDGFWGNNNNYMFYIDESAVLHFIPFDTDNALGTSLFVDDVGLRDPFVFGRQSTTPLLVSKIMAIDEYRIEYAGYIRTLVEQDDLLRQQYAVDWIANVHSLIEDHLDNVTGEHEVIADKPASWGNQSDYRLFDFSSGRSFYTTRQATVIDAIGLPIADAGPDVQLIIGETFTLDGSNSTDPNGDIVSFAWSNEQNGSASALSFSAAGTYTATLTVTDSDGYTASDEITITVVPAPVTDDMSGSSGGGGAISFILLLLIIARLGLLSKPSEA
jgi:spore coat protein H